MSKVRSFIPSFKDEEFRPMVGSRVGLTDDVLFPNVLVDDARVSLAFDI